LARRPETPTPKKHHEYDPNEKARQATPRKKSPCQETAGKQASREESQGKEDRQEKVDRCDNG
jgi:hypothetical protein